MGGPSFQQSGLFVCLLGWGGLTNKQTFRNEVTEFIDFSGQSCDPEIVQAS